MMSKERPLASDGWIDTRFIRLCRHFRISADVVTIGQYCAVKTQTARSEDVTEAKKHLDLSQDFPFKGHGSSDEDLKAIAEAVDNGSMPPFRYRILHPDSKLSEADKKKVVGWVDESLKLMKK